MHIRYTYIQRKETKIKLQTKGFIFERFGPGFDKTLPISFYVYLTNRVWGLVIYF